jgi:hypothetical protein
MWPLRSAKSSIPRWRGVEAGAVGLATGETEEGIRADRHALAARQTCTRFAANFQAYVSLLKQTGVSCGVHSVGSTPARAR